MLTAADDVVIFLLHEEGHARERREEEEGIKVSRANGSSVRYPASHPASHSQVDRSNDLNSR